MTQKKIIKRGVNKKSKRKKGEQKLETTILEQVCLTFQKAEGYLSRLQTMKGAIINMIRNVQQYYTLLL